MERTVSVISRRRRIAEPSPAEITTETKVA
jgi:hypothetical protein